jgi:AraC-like DNA-binding protein
LNFNLFNSLLFAGIIQGIFLSVFILTSKKHKEKGSRYLGLLILVFTLSNLQYSLEEIELISTEVFNYIFVPYAVLIPPFLFFFGITFIYPNRKPKSKEVFLYLPFVVFFIISSVYKIINLFLLKTEFVKKVLDGIIIFIDAYSDLILIPLIVFVIIILLIRIKEYEKTHNKFDFKIIKRELLWFKILLILFLLLTLILTYYTIQYIIDFQISFLPFYIIVSLFIYLLGYIGIHKIGILKQRKKIRYYSNKKQNIVLDKKAKNEHIITLENSLINKKQFLDPTLTLDKLAMNLNLSKSYLSRLINTELEISFNDYLNKLRVEQAKEYLKNPEFSNYTLVAIGLEAGFNSKSTFNNAFKKVTKITPSEYKKQLN